MVLFRPLIDWVSWATLGQGILAYHLHFFYLLLFFVAKRCLRCVASIYVCMRMSTHHRRACKSQPPSGVCSHLPSLTPPHTHILCIWVLCPHVCPCTISMQFPRRLEGPEEGVVSSGGTVSPALVSPSGLWWLNLGYQAGCRCLYQMSQLAGPK